MARSASRGRLIGGSRLLGMLVTFLAFVLPDQVMFEQILLSGDSSFGTIAGVFAVGRCSMSVANAMFSGQCFAVLRSLIDFTAHCSFSRELAKIFCVGRVYSLPFSRSCIAALIYRRKYARPHSDRCARTQKRLNRANLCYEPKGAR